MRLLLDWIAGLLLTMVVGTVLFMVVLMRTGNPQAAFTVAGATGLIGGFSFAYHQNRRDH